MRELTNCRRFSSRKTTYAEIRFADFPASQNDDDLKGNSNLVTQMREVDAMALVLRDFELDADPLRQLNDLLTEMILADLTVVENRRTRLKKRGTAAGRSAARTLRDNFGE